MKRQDQLRQKPKRARSGIISILLYLVLGYLVMVNSIGATKIIGRSMEATLRDGSIVLIDKLSPRIKQPKHGDVIIIKRESKGYNMTKRVIGLPGDTVMIQDGIVYVNHVPLPEIYTLGKPNDMDQVIVEKETLFVLGDNRTPGESLDSRSDDIGLIKMAEVKGHVLVSVFPYYRIMKPLKI